ncbi:Cell cycle response regulator CtrA [Candidatus Xenohaliotis californiensis]|uniref:Cell cycle response regulator CtrA n=1 Tax=Candidatus Xenohaliotis californiensis TaxID=84677 RepID=A0ABM9N8Y5_9RICK|nr:Cell cycle response regulator CtrA [Candidatus Xenohaliotis californiensis]
MRALLVEDDFPTARSVELALSVEGIACDTCTMGEQGVEVAMFHDYDIIILDLNLEDMDGCDAILRIRSAKVKAPILILSGITCVERKVKGLGFGADDYMTKPFNRSELIARVQAVVRRSKGHPDSIIEIGKLKINLDNRMVEVNGVVLHLTSKEYAILELLALRAGSTLTKEVFLNHLYGGIDEPELKIIDVFVCKLRKKLSKAAGGENYIETAWGRGYTLKYKPYNNNVRKKVDTTESA